MSTRKTTFSYVVLRYMHDVFTREFVNVAVLVYAPQTGYLGFKKLSNLERVKGLFPGLQSDSLQGLLRFLASRVGEVAAKTSELLDRNSLSAEAVARTLLPIDDSALQWSPPGGGATEKPEQVLEELFDRLVARHLKAHPPTRRDDADVWKPFELEFRRRDILTRLQEKTLSVGELRHRFETAWQPPGSYLRLYQPLSFDLLEPSDIVEKAVRWNGLLGQLRKANPDFRIFLLLGRPSDRTRMRAFEQASETLREEDGKLKQLVFEEQAPTFAQQVEQEIKTLAS